MSRPKPRIVDCMCPKGHRIQTLAYEPGVTELADGTKLTPEQAVAAVRAITELQVATGYLDPCCALCGAREDQWTYADRVLDFDSLDDARPYLRDVARAQALLRMYAGRKN